MDIVQSFYDGMANQYDQLFQDWHATVGEQAEILERMFYKAGFDRSASVLDCACGIGTQAIGLAAKGYAVTASDISREELFQAKERAEDAGVQIQFARADFRHLEDTLTEQFDIVIAMDNALPHMLTAEDLKKAIESIAGRVAENGIFVASIRDYDALLSDRPPYSPPYIHKTEQGKRVSFQTWDWEGECYQLTQYIIADEAALQVSRFRCAYRATRREEITKLLYHCGCSKVHWQFPEETGFYQPIVIARK